MNKNRRFILGIIGLLLVSGSMSLLINPNITTSASAPLTDTEISLNRFFGAVGIVGGIFFFIIACSKKASNWWAKKWDKTEKEEVG